VLPDGRDKSYAQKVAVIPNLLHNPPLTYNHTPLLYIVKAPLFKGAIASINIDFAGFFKNQAGLKYEDIHRVKII
jgi:hypothetical protein